MTFKVGQKQKKVLKKYNCFKASKSKDFNKSFGIGILRKWRLELAMDALEKDFSYINHRDFSWDLCSLQKVPRYLSKNVSNAYKIRTIFEESLINFKVVTRINPIFYLHHVIYYFLVQLHFIHVKRHNISYDIPRMFFNDTVSLLQTFKNFCLAFKKQKDYKTDLKAQLSLEFIFILSNIKKSVFYNRGLTPFYARASEGTKFVHFKW